MILEFFSLIYLSVWVNPLLMAVLTLLGKPFIVGLPYLRLKSAITGPHNLLPRGAGRGRYLCPEYEVDLVPRNKIRKFCFFFTPRCSKTWMFLKTWIWLWCRLSVKVVKKCLIHLQEFALNSIKLLKREKEKPRTCQVCNHLLILLYAF